MNKVKYSMIPVAFFAILGLAACAAFSTSNNGAENVKAVDQEATDQEAVNPKAVNLAPVRLEGIPGSVAPVAEETQAVLRVGQELQVILPANPTTGYAWKVARLPAVLRQLGPEEYIREAGRENMAGAGGTSLWRFEALAPGNGELELTYQREWEKDVPPVKTARYKVLVAPN